MQKRRGRGKVREVESLVDMGFQIYKRRLGDILIDPYNRFGLGRPANYRTVVIMTRKGRPAQRMLIEKIPLSKRHEIHKLNNPNDENIRTKPHYGKVTK